MTAPEHAERTQGYEAFFGLTEAPFSLAPDPRFLFASESHSAVFEQVAYALQRREPLVVITGEIGTGKTLLCRTVLQGLGRKTFLSIINDPLLERDDLLKQLLEDFGVIAKDRSRLTETSRHELIEALQAFLRSLGAIKAHAVVIIDEAQHLQPDVLEEIRLLSNIEDERGTLLQIILVGQTDLDPLLSRPELRQLQQRISRRLKLGPLNADEVQRYIEHRLARARIGKPSSQAPGATDLARELGEWAGTNEGVEFTSAAILAVSELSGGLPRVVNLLCDRSLEEAHASRLRIIDRPVIEAAARALGIEVPPARATTPENLHTIARPPIRPDQSFWGAKRPGSGKADQIVEDADQTALIELNAGTPARAPWLTTYVVLAIALAVAAVAIWFGIRATPVAQAPSPATAAASSTTSAPGAPRDAAPADANALRPAAAATVGTPTPPEATAPAPSAVAAPATGGRFDIVVASFRTDARATSLAAEVAALGLPSRRRASEGWQQVLAGPFASRADAEEAQQRLHRAGIAGTQIVAAAR